MFKYMKDFEKRLIEEYCELRERTNKLHSAIDKGDEFKQTVGEEQFKMLSDQLNAMETYKSILSKRINDLGLDEHVPVVSGKDTEDEEMLSREKIVTKAYTDCLEEMYQKSQPSASYLEYCEKYRKGELTDKDRVYEWHYLSQQEYEYIVDKYVYAYGMTKKWDDYINTVAEYFNNGATKDKWIEEHTDEYGDWHPGYRGYEKLDDFAKVVEDTLNANQDKSAKELGDAIKALVLQRIDTCKNFYRFDREEGDFKASVALGASPTSNPETVKKYWKEKGVELEIVERDPDTLWERDYYGDDYEDYINDKYDDCIEEGSSED